MDKDFANADNELSNATLTGTYRDLYAVYNIEHSGYNNPQYGTLGFTLSIGSASLIYFEYQYNDNDGPGDNETIVRATFKVDFGVF